MHSTSATLSTVIAAIIGNVFNPLVLALSTLALVIFLWGGVRFIWGSSNKEGHGADKQLLIWGIIALFVLFSLGGLVRFVEIALLGKAV